MCIRDRVAAYVRVVTVRITLINDWISFIPALLFANFVYFISLYYSDFSINYFYLLKNSIFTFIFYPVLWGLFSLLLKWLYYRKKFIYYIKNIALEFYLFSMLKSGNVNFTTDPGSTAMRQ